MSTRRKRKAFIKVGPPGGKTVEPTEYELFLPGLVIHKPPDQPDKYAVKNITHKNSGLAIMPYVPECELEIVKEILAQVNWTCTTRALHNNAEAWSVVAEAGKLIMSKESEKQEKLLAKIFGGKRQPGSGNRWGYRRDVLTSDILIEAKTTKSDSTVLDLVDLVFLRKQARKQDKIPVYVIEMSEVGGEFGSSVYIFDGHDFYDPEGIKTIRKAGALELYPLEAQRGITLNGNFVLAIAQGHKVGLMVYETIPFIVIDMKKALAFTRKLRG